uniref:Uncharacterized protein n=1 Tax=Callithrix jacchus TaxID=9483 RepID=A0A8I3WPF4_CALJA
MHLLYTCQMSSWNSENTPSSEKKEPRAVIEYPEKFREPQRQGLALSPRLKSSGAITDYCSLQFLGLGNPPASISLIAGTKGMCHHTWLFFNFVVVVEMGSHYIAEVSLKLLGSSVLLPQTP